MGQYFVMGTSELDAKVKTLLKAHEGEVLKLDVGCGNNKEQGVGWIGIDYRKFGCVDVVHDLTKTPWPFPDKTFSLLSAADVIEHIPRDNMGLIKFMDEAWRVLKYDGQFRIKTPYAGSTMFWADPTHVTGIVPQFFHYFDPLAPLKTYWLYQPKPWKIEQLYWSVDGNIEALLTKRREDPSYGRRD